MMNIIFDCIMNAINVYTFDDDDAVVVDDDDNDDDA